ncbi:hypothetical protein Pla163_10540 [Planctomycetes bacterium Pla163]|uniref:AlgX/AlgJ SGNH hydrolase-like domain-containing protein n=1 Tax=Rohdeia mirabilis TaxID=2528008 RepID=A0A518CXJ5_9BACT|nr:hypothetical protein Pla163_10540 [Planctomycetes bacterium Pla163]
MSSKLTTGLFLALICGVPVVQAGLELARGEDVQALEVFGPIEESRLRAYEDDLRAASFLHRDVAPWFQALELFGFAHGNERATVGDDGWLFFDENLDYVTGAALDAERQAAIRDTIDDFGRQLAERGVELVLVPLRAKVAAQPQHFASSTRELVSAENPAARGLLDSITGATVWDPFTGPAPTFMPRDTHWDPATMARTARSVAKLVEVRLAAKGDALVARRTWTTEPASAAVVGDLATMLRLPEGLTPWAPMEVDLERVVDARSGAAFAPERGAEVLLLGDSSTLVFSDARLEAGTGAGFGEHLAAALGAPVDVIALAGGSARAVRETLARRADGLAGAKVVVWQISMRDFAGDASKWERVELPAAGASGARVSDGGPFHVRAELVEVTRIPSEFEYELCLGIHEYRVLEVLDGAAPDGPLWVAHTVVEDFEPTAKAGYQVGDVHELWLEDVARHHDLESTSWMDATESDPRAVIWFAIDPNAGPRADATAPTDLTADLTADLATDLATDPGTPPGTELDPVRLTVSPAVEAARAETRRLLEERIAGLERSGLGDELVASVSEQLDAAPDAIWFGMGGWNLGRIELGFVRSMNSHVGGDPERPVRGLDFDDEDHPIHAIEYYAKTLSEHGITLLVVPVPNRVQVQSDLMPNVGADPNLLGGDLATPQLLLEMARRGIDVVDLYPRFAEARLADRAAGRERTLFQDYNAHWSPRGVRIGAQLVAQRIRALPWFEQGPLVEGTDFEIVFEERRSTAPQYGDAPEEQQLMPFDRVLRPNGRRLLERDQSSPILVMGDSYAGMYNAEGADICSHLIAELGHPVDYITVSNGGANSVWQSLARRGDNLAGVKVVVWNVSRSVLDARDMRTVDLFGE